MVSASFLAAAIPMVLYLIIIWRMDKYDPEPIGYIVLHFVWGAVGAIVLGIIGLWILLSQVRGVVTDEASLNILSAVVVAPIVEEFTKGLFLFFTIRWKHFDNMTDGLVYGGAIGLGFGMTENFLYFISYGETIEAWIYLVVIRSGFSAVMHCIATASLGGMMGLAKFTYPHYRITLTFLGFCIAVFLHFVWNMSVSFESTYVWGFAFLFMIIIFFFALFGLAIKREERMFKNQLQGEVPDQHLKILSSPLRYRRGWMDENKRKLYIKTATKLAFKKAAAAKMSGTQQLMCMQDVEYYRDLLRRILQS